MSFFGWMLFSFGLISIEGFVVTLIIYCIPTLINFFLISKIHLSWKILETILFSFIFLTFSEELSPIEKGLFLKEDFERAFSNCLKSYGLE
jgi:energy-coupling factor transporter transmembrane protein EcfT